VHRGERRGELAGGGRVAAPMRICVSGPTPAIDWPMAACIAIVHVS
jgi:hypothetical protein